MATSPFFSIIIPTLNEEMFLPRLLANIAAQTTDKYEVIHIDGHSVDNTLTLAQKAAKNLPSFKQIISPIRHVSHQRNLGARAATGQYYLFIDADGQLPSYFLEGLSYQLHRSPTDIFTTWYRPDSNRAADKAIVTAINLSQDISHSLEAPFAIGTMIGCTPKAYQKIGGFREDVSFGEDEDFIKTGHQQGLTFTVFRQPRLIISLRRFRKEGTITSLQQLASKRLNAITADSQRIFKPKDYLMGGHVFKEDTTNKKVFVRLDNAIKQFTKRPKLKKLLQDLITFQDLED